MHVSAENQNLFSQHLQRTLDQIRHENDLLNHRLTWIWALQGFLLAALGILLKEVPDKQLAWLVCLTGFISCISIGYSLHLGVRVLDRLNPYAAKLVADLEQFFDIENAGTTEPVGVKCNFSFLLPWKLLPWFLAGTWVAAAVIVGMK